MKQKTILESFFYSSDLSLKPLFEELQSDLFNPSQKTNYFNTTPEELGLPPIQEIIPIGTIYYGTWGYDTTSVQFYQVVGHTSSQIVLLKKIDSEPADQDPESTPFSSGTYVVPLKDVFIEPTIYQARFNPKLWNQQKYPIPPLRLSRKTGGGINLELLPYDEEGVGIYTS